jgi:preprotein translocase subunit SecD
MIFSKAFFFTLFFAIALSLTLRVGAESPEQLRERYEAASPAQRQQIMQGLMKQRQAERIARFALEKEGELTREEWQVAAEAERRAWQTYQTERNREIQAALLQNQRAREAALRQRREVYTDRDLTEAEKQAIMQTIRREQEAHRQRRQ